MFYERVLPLRSAPQTQVNTQPCPRRPFAWIRQQSLYDCTRARGKPGGMALNILALDSDQPPVYKGPAEQK